MMAFKPIKAMRGSLSRAACGVWPEGVRSSLGAAVDEPTNGTHAGLYGVRLPRFRGWSRWSRTDPVAPDATELTYILPTVCIKYMYVYCGPNFKA